MCMHGANDVAFGDDAQNGAGFNDQYRTDRLATHSCQCVERGLIGFDLTQRAGHDFRNWFLLFVHLITSVRHDGTVC